MAKHGTRASYNEGCRCRKCTNEVAAYAWASRNIKQWSRDICFEVTHCAKDDGEPIDNNSVAHVLCEYMNRLKMAILMQEWRRLNNEKENKKERPI